ncbi:ribosomal subunit interface protein [bacterium (Candidatus Gribaldobacteria) CG07_land_8_20_14_0_80_33_18]|uniref:Ribosomal subunit interface protein n=1 Tax=bacterium (Candidatus Gribaldobacteria) CG07_land_8_20_14_0_80_33_18 TaxID=2014272 RepID=A0A2M6Z407_9BACT|nr:MAG: ribosomal subunit interface protein [bacterium (Candidatus Gribaldobacteria) CG07_land_8_20_14_0_80_33_18]
MKIVIKATNIKLTDVLEKYTIEKLTGLEKFLKPVFEKTQSVMHIEIGKLSKHHRTGNIFYAEGQLFLPGKILRAVAERKNFKLAIVEIKDELQRQLKHIKRKK